MKSLAALILLAAGALATRAAEPALLPTTPQIPPPVVHQEGGTIIQAGWGERALPPVAQPCEGCATPAGPVDRHAGGCGTSICPGSPIKKWLCFHPTTGHALPWLKPAPYVGPITGQFTCTSSAGPGCASGAGCEAGGAGGAGCGAGRGAAGLLGRGCNGKGGTCTPPPDDAFAGYKFATPVSTQVAVPGAAAPRAGGSYRTAVPPTGMASPPAPARTPTVLESLKRAFARP